MEVLRVVELSRFTQLADRQQVHLELGARADRSGFPNEPRFGLLVVLLQDVRGAAQDLRALRRVRRRPLALCLRCVGGRAQYLGCASRPDAPERVAGRRLDDVERLRCLGPAAVPELAVCL